MYQPYKRADVGIMKRSTIPPFRTIPGRSTNYGHYKLWPLGPYMLDLGPMVDHTDGLDDPDLDTHPSTRMEPPE
jgi:hypothetical protein